MRFAASARTQFFTATALSLALIFAVLAVAAPPPGDPAPAGVAPEFFTFGDEPFADDLNHFLIRLEESATVDGDGPLRLDADGTIALTAGEVPSSVDPEELAAAIGGGSSEVNPAAFLSAREDVAAVREVGFGIFAAAGSIDLATLAGLPGVAAAEHDHGVVTASADPLFPSQWGLENDGTTAEPWAVAADADIDADGGWHRTRGAGVVVAVIDSGVDITHPDLAANIWQNPGETCDNGVDDDNNGYVDDCHGWDFINDDNTPEDLNGHGTHVAGIIGAVANNKIGIAGVAYESRVMALKIGNEAPPLSAAIEAIAYAIDNGARVINASWVSDEPTAAEFLTPAFDAAAAAGVLIVTGAGNFGTDIDAEPIFPASLTHANLITVGASTPLDAPAVYSGFGSGSVDLFAPGEHIVSTLPGGTYGAFSGTSMAAPMVSGAAALLWAATPTATYSEVKGALLDRSDGPNDGVTAFRNLARSDGRLNVARAIYTQLFRPSLMYTFYDFNSFEPDVAHDVSIVAKTVDPWIAPPQTPAKYRLGLYVPYEGAPMAVTNMPLTHIFGGIETAAVTDGTGRALIGPEWERENRPVLVQEGDATEIRMSLPYGTYAVTMEVVDITNPANPATLGRPSAVFFVVGIDGSVTQMPETPIGVNPPPPPSTTAPTTTAPGGSSSTTTDAPGSTTTITTTVAPGATTTTTTTDPGSGGSTTTTTSSPPTTTTSTTTTTASPTTTTLEPGSSTTTTTTSTTQAPTTSSTTTTSTTTTTVAPTTTTTIDPTLMRITDVSPSEGPTSGGDLVTVTGANFPERPLVDFGELRATTIVTATDSFIVLQAPRGTPGLVDVKVTDRTTEDFAVYEDGYLYVGPDSPTTTIAATTTTGAPPTTVAPPPTTQPPGGGIDDWLDGVLVTPDGLTLAPVDPSDPMAQVPVELWAGSLCAEPVCPGWVLGS